MEEFHKVRRLPPYVFEQVNRLKASARARGADIIDLGMGNPDLPTPKAIVDKLCEAVRDPRTHRYSSSRGIPGLRRAQASYYARRFGVKLDPDTQVVATLGSKEGFANMAQAITAPGDVVLCPNPTYPIHAFGFIMSGGVIRSMPAEPDDDFIPALERAIRHSIPKPLALILNYPSNPTAWSRRSISTRRSSPSRRRTTSSSCPISPIPRSISTATPPPSVLQVPGAIDVAVEFTSMSKTFSMPGWRMGFAVGNERLIAALARVKSYLDYGAFTPIQVAAAAALNGDGADIAEVREVYHKRRDVMVESFGRAGWDDPGAGGTMFAWAPIPEQFRASGLARILQAADRAGRRRRRAGRRLRRTWRRLHPPRAGRERAAHPPGRAQHQAASWRRRPSSPTTWCRSPRGAERRYFSERRDRGALPLMAEALRVGIAGLGTVGASVVRMLAGNGRRTDPPVRPRDRRDRRFGARPQRATAASISARREWFDDPVELAAKRRYRRLRRTDRRRRGRGARIASRRRSRPAAMSSPPTRRCLPSMASRLPRSPRRRACCSTTRRRSPAAFRSSRRCARRWPAIRSRASSASSTAPATTS